MAETVRAERRRIEAAAPASRRKNALSTKRQWKERKRRAWDKTKPTFEAALGRQFTPERFTFTPFSRGSHQYVRVSINYEGKLFAFMHIFNDDNRVPWLNVRPIDAPDKDARALQCEDDVLYDKLASLIEEWGLG